MLFLLQTKNRLMIQLLILNIWINLWALKLKHAYVLRKSFHNLCYWTNDDNCQKILICRLRLNTCNCYRYQLHTTSNLLSLDNYKRQNKTKKQISKQNKNTKKRKKKKRLVQLSRRVCWDPISRFNLATILCLFQARTWIAKVTCRVKLF